MANSLTESWEIIFSYNKHHTETCPQCYPEPDDNSEIMVRRSPDVFECVECGLLLLSGWDRYHLSKRYVLGRSLDADVSLDFSAPVADGSALADGKFQAG